MFNPCLHFLTDLSALDWRRSRVVPFGRKGRTLLGEDDGQSHAVLMRVVMPALVAPVEVALPRSAMNTPNGHASRRCHSIRSFLPRCPLMLVARGALLAVVALDMALVTLGNDGPRGALLIQPVLQPAAHRPRLSTEPLLETTVSRNLATSHAISTWFSASLPHVAQPSRFLRANISR